MVDGLVQGSLATASLRAEKGSKEQRQNYLASMTPFLEELVHLVSERKNLVALGEAKLLTRIVLAAGRRWRIVGHRKV